MTFNFIRPDEIPDLKKLSEIKKKKKFIAFLEKMFMYKKNLQNIDERWIKNYKKKIF